MLWLEMLIQTNAYAWGTQSEREGNNDYFTKLLFWQLQEGLCPHILLNLGRANSKSFPRFALILSKNVCPPWPETVPVPLVESFHGHICRFTTMS